MRSSLGSLFILLFLFAFGSGFPDGAPGGKTCVSHRPSHGAKSQPLDTLPFIVQATSSSFKAGEPVAVRIQGKAGVYFKGFFVQALDAGGRWIGTFEPTAFSVSHDECSMTTHSENKEKEEVTLIWNPPKDVQQGTVKFLASILQSYKIFWVDVEAQAPKKSRFG